jgi:hypothetical protein
MRFVGGRASDRIKSLFFDILIFEQEYYGIEVRTLRQSPSLWQRYQPRQQHPAATVESQPEARARAFEWREEASPRLHGLHPRRPREESCLRIHS